MAKIQSTARQRADNGARAASRRRPAPRRPVRRRCGVAEDVPCYGRAREPPVPWFSAARTSALAVLIAKEAKKGPVCADWWRFAEGVYRPDPDISPFNPVQAKFLQRICSDRSTASASRTSCSCESGQSKVRRGLGDSRREIVSSLLMARRLPLTDRAESQQVTRKNNSSQ